MIGGRTLFEAIDEIVATKPEQVWLRFFESSEALRQGTLRTVTFAELDTAINALAWWIRDTLGDASDGSTFCYIGPSDIIYYLLAFAASKCGWKVGPPSSQVGYTANDAHCLFDRVSSLHRGMI
jgi:hypothetical protein